MENNVIIDEELKEQIKSSNEGVLLNKRNVDVDKSMESLVSFFSEYAPTRAIDICEQICLKKGIDSKSDEGLFILEIVKTFLNNLIDELKKQLTEKKEVIKGQIDNLTDEEVNNKLRDMSMIVYNHLLEYLKIKIEELIDVVASNETEEVKETIRSYLNNYIYGKIMNTLKENMMIYIHVVDNNTEENNIIFQRINEKTLN